MSKKLPVLVLASLLGASACAVEGPVIEEVQGAQCPVNPDKIFREFALIFQTPTPVELARIRVVGEAPAGYESNTEYWFVNRTALPLLGRYPLQFALVYEGEVDPPDPDYPSMQLFEQPVYPAGGWGRGWVGDPFQGGVLYSGPSYSLRLFVDAAGISRVIWYQVIPASEPARHQEPAGLYRVAQGISVPRGFLGYSIDQLVH